MKKYKLGGSSFTKITRIYEDEVDYVLEDEGKFTPLEWVMRRHKLEEHLPKSLLDKGFVYRLGELISRKEIREHLRQAQKGSKTELYYKILLRKPVDYFKSDDVAKTFRMVNKK